MWYFRDLAHELDTHWTASRVHSFHGDKVPGSGGGHSWACSRRSWSTCAPRSENKRTKTLTLPHTLQKTLLSEGCCKLKFKPPHDAKSLRATKQVSFQIQSYPNPVTYPHYSFLLTNVHPFPLLLFVLAVSPHCSSVSWMLLDNYTASHSLPWLYEGSECVEIFLDVSCRLSLCQTLNLIKNC